MGYSLSGKLRPKGVQCTFFRLQVYERVGISRVEVCERVGKYRYFEGAKVICSKQIHLRYKEKKTKRKRHHFLIEGIWKGYLFCQKWCIKG